MTCASLAVSVFTLDDSGLLTSLIISILQQASSLLYLRVSAMLGNSPTPTSAVMLLHRPLPVVLLAPSALF